jgi:hypothetical protein
MKRKIIELMVMLPIAFANGQTTSTGAEKDFDVHNTDVRYHFSDGDMDFNFSTIVSPLLSTYPYVSLFKS